jgi:hypothetical protein
MLKKFLKILHEIGAVGVMGSFAACLVLVVTAPTHSLIALAAVRQSVADVSKWLLMPSLVLVLVSGLLAIAATSSYHNAGWAWLKGLLGLGLFEGGLLAVSDGARRASELATLAASGQGDPAQAAQVVHSEWVGLAVMLTLSLANIVLAVWRPRLGRRGSD